MNKFNLIPAVEYIVNQIITEGKGGTDYVTIRRKYEKKYPETFTDEGNFTRGKSYDATQLTNYETYRTTPILNEFKEEFAKAVALFKDARPPVNTLDDFTTWINTALVRVSRVPEYKSAFVLLDELMDIGTDALETAFNYFKKDTTENLEKLYLEFYKKDPGTKGRTGGSPVQDYNSKSKDFKSLYFGWPPLKQPVSRKETGEKTSKPPGRSISTKDILPFVNDDLCCSAYDYEQYVIKGKTAYTATGFNKELAKDRFAELYKNSNDFRQAIHTSLSQPKFKQSTGEVITYELSRSGDAMANPTNRKLVDQLYDYLFDLGEDRKYTKFDTRSLADKYIKNVLGGTLVAGRRPSKDSSASSKPIQKRDEEGEQQQTLLDAIVGTKLVLERFIGIIEDHGEDDPEDYEDPQLFKLQIRVSKEAIIAGEKFIDVLKQAIKADLDENISSDIDLED